MTLQTTAICIGLLSFFVAGDANAQFRYQFEREISREVLAILQLSSLPAMHNDIESLTFTPIGEALYGFGPNYLGTFDTTDTKGASVTANDNGSGELLCVDCNSVQQVSFIDNDPPPASGGFPDAIFSINLFDDVSTLSRNSTPFRAGGNWVAVPEPATSVLLAATLVMLQVTRKPPQSRAGYLASK